MGQLPFLGLGAGAGVGSGSDWTVPAAVKVVTVLTKWLLLVMESTTTIMVSFPLDSGSSVIKSTLMVSQGPLGIGRGCNSPVGS